MRRIGVMALWVALLGGPALAEDGAQDRTQEMDQDRDQIRDRSSEYDALQEQLRDQLRLGGKDVKLCEGEMKRYLRQGGDPERLRATVQVAFEAGCNGVCLQEAVRTLNWARAWGMEEEPANQMIQETVRATAGAATGADFGDQIRTRAQEHLREWQRDRFRALEQERDRLQQQQRETQEKLDRAMEQQQQQGGAGEKKGAGGSP